MKKNNKKIKNKKLILKKIFKLNIILKMINHLITIINIILIKLKKMNIKNNN
jgi:hypothetical protein